MALSILRFLVSWWKSNRLIGCLVQCVRVCVCVCVWKDLSVDFGKNSSVVAYRLFRCLCVALSIQLVVCDFLFILNIKLYKIFRKNIVSNWIWSEFISMLIELPLNWFQIEASFDRLLIVKAVKETQAFSFAHRCVVV